MIVFYSNHALKRMLERTISASEVERTLQSPDKVENSLSEKRAIKKKWEIKR